MKNISVVLLSLLIVALSFFTILPLLHSGFFNFHDNTQVVRVIEMGKSLSSGMFPVRWVEGLGYGYGYPIFNFYGPLPYYLGGLFLQIGFDGIIATKMMFVVGIIFSGISMFLLARKIFGEIAGIVCGILYAYFPYHAVNIYVRGAVGEFFAYAFLPLLFLGIFGLLQSREYNTPSSKNIKYVLITAWGTLFIATSHNLTLFMILLLLIPILIVSTVVAKNKRTFLFGSIAGLILGLALSAFYVVPAFLEMRYTNVSSQIGGGADFRDHFVCLSQYWNSMWGYGGSVKGCVDGISFKLGKFDIFLLVSSLLVLSFSLYKRKWGKAEKISCVAVILLIISLFFTLEISKEIWKAIPYMQYLQYPWRFINFIGLFMILIIGYLLYRIEKLFSKKVLLLISVAIIVVTIIINYKLFEPQQYVNFPLQYYENNDYINYTVSKISDEYMPPSFSVPQRTEEIPLNEFFLVNTVGKVETLESRVNYQKSSFDIEKDGVLHINKAYFPAWRAYENGLEIPIVPTHDGMNVSIHKGNGIFELKFRQTTTEVIANTISILALAIAIIVIIIPNLQTIKRKKTV